MSARRCEELLDAWLDQGHEDVAADLDRLLREDPVARARFVHIVRLDARLRSVLPRAPRSAPTVDARQSRAATASRPHLRRARREPRRLAPWVVVMGFVVVGLAAAIGVKFAIGHRSAGADDRIATRDGQDGPIAVLAGQGIVTGGEATHLVLGDGATRVDLTPGTSARIDHEDRGERVRLDRGGLSAEVAARTRGRPFVVQTPQATASVVGTAFSVDAGDTTRVRVDRGTVVVEASGASESLGPGDAAWCDGAHAPRVARHLDSVLDALVDPEAWTYRSRGLHLITLNDGMIGRRCLRIEAQGTGQEETWLATVFAQPEDFSRYEGLSLVLTGPGVGKQARVLLALLDARMPTPPQGVADKTAWTFADLVHVIADFDGWREVRVPFAMFERAGGMHADAASLRSTRGLMIVMSAGVAVSLERIGLYTR